MTDKRKAIDDLELHIWKIKNLKKVLLDTFIEAKLIPEGTEKTIMDKTIEYLEEHKKNLKEQAL